MKDKMLEDFYLKGYVRFNDPEMSKEIDIESLHWTDPGLVGLKVVKRNADVEASLDKTQKLINKYVSMIDENFVEHHVREIVDGMDATTLMWHNDLVEGPNLAVLLYFDSMDEDIGGAFCIRDRNTKEFIDSFYPQRGDVLIMNHGERFEHCVTPLKLQLPRRVATVNYYVNELLTK
jgi:hypothetical protein